MARSGHEIADELFPLKGDALQSAILRLSRAGEVPDAIKSQYWRTAEVTATDANGKTHTLRLLVAPSFYALGTNADPLWPMLTPKTLQSIADDYHSIFPSRRLARAIWQAADVKLPLQDVKGPPYHVPLTQIETTDAMVKATAMIQSALSGRSMKDHLIAGEKKDIVIGPNLDGSRVAIYGGQGGTVDGAFWQPYSTIHGSSYTDYSHGSRLVYRRATLDGREIDLFDLFQDPVLHALVSDQGPFVPRFPNVGGGVKPTLPPAPSGSAPPKMGGMPVATLPPRVSPSVPSAAVPTPTPTISRSPIVVLALAAVGIGLLGATLGRQ